MEYVRRNHVLNIKQLMNNKKYHSLHFIVSLFVFCVHSIELLFMQLALMCVNKQAPLSKKSVFLKTLRLNLRGLSSLHLSKNVKVVLT